MINRKKIRTGRNIWYQNEKYKIEQILCPNKFHDYLLCSRYITEMIHGDGKTPVIEMILLDCHNDEFYVATKEVNNLIKKLNTQQNKVDKFSNSIKKELLNNWLDVVINK